MFDLTCQLASPEPADEETLGLFRMIAAIAAANEDFASVIARTMPVPAFFDPANLDRLFVAAG